MSLFDWCRHVEFDIFYFVSLVRNLDQVYLRFEKSYLKFPTISQQLSYLLQKDKLFWWCLFSPVVAAHRKLFEQEESHLPVNITCQHWCLIDITFHIFVSCWTITYHPLKDNPKNNMAPIQPRCIHGKDGKHGTIGVFSKIGHVDPTSSVMVEFKVLVIKSLTINTQTFIRTGKKKER